MTSFAPRAAASRAYVASVAKFASLFQRSGVTRRPATVKEIGAACRPAAARSISKRISCKDTLLFPALLPRQLTLDIRPELLQHIGKHVGGELNGELLRVIGDSARVRIVSVRDRHGSRIPNQLGEIEPRPPGVGTGNKDTAHGVAHPRPFATLPPPEVALIFPQQAGKNRLGHHIPDDLISVCSR